MLQDQTIPIDFGEGIDTKTDPKLVVPGKYLRLENAVFTSPKRAAKRNGYSALAALTDPKMAHEYNGELLAADANLLKGYSSADNAWVSRGPYISTELTPTSIDQANPSSGYVDSAIFGNYALYGWSTAVQQNTGFATATSKTYGSVVDLSSGALLSGNTLLSTRSSAGVYNHVKCVLLGGSVLAIFYIKADSSALVCRVVTLSGGGVATFGSEQTVTTSLSATSLWFDVVETASGASLAYFSSTGITVANISTTGAVTATASIADANAYGPISISLNASNLWVYWCDAAGGPPITSNSIVYAIYSTALSSVLSKTTVAAQIAPYYVSNIIALNTSATTQTIYYGKYTATSANLYTDATFQVTANTAGSVGSSTLFSGGVYPYSKPFTDNSISYAVFIYRSAVLQATGTVEPVPTQPTYFVIKLGAESIPVCAARFGYGQAGSQCTLQTTVGFSPSVRTVSSRKYELGVGVQTQEYSSDYFTNQNIIPGGLSGAFSYEIDFNSDNAYIGVNAGELAVFNGGLMHAYDGQTVSEFGFHLAPEIVKLTATTGSGSVANGTYSYIAVYQWVDGQGNLHQSQPSLPVSITSSGASNEINITVDAAYLSQKPNIGIAIYRTINGGTNYFLITNPIIPLTADPTVTTAASWTDRISDANIQGNTQAYTYPGSSVLENGTTPPCMIMLAHNNRLWFVDSEVRNRIWYTKIFQKGFGLSPCPLMTEDIDPKLGNITALAEMDSNLVILKELTPMVQSGDGVNDVGANSTLSAPQVIPSDVGCSELKSVITTPNGVMFKSPNGIYLLSRALGVAYIGSEVELYNSQRISSAKAVSGKSQIRFLCSSGLTLVYDYIFNKWSTFTNHTGLSSTSWRSTYVYVSTTGTILKEAPGVYTDNGTSYKLLLQTSWLALGRVQGFQRVRLLSMLGDFANGSSALHGIQVSAAYDFSPSFQPAVPFVFGAASASGVLQYQERLPIQKCDAISLLIEEIVTGDPLEYLDLTNMSFEAGVKRGLNKLPASRSVG